MNTESHIIIGTAGHIDHGKTTLVHSLTGSFLDSTPEEKATRYYHTLRIYSQEI